MQKKNAVRLKSQPDNRKNAFELKGQQTMERMIPGRNGLDK